MEYYRLPAVAGLAFIVDQAAKWAIFTNLITWHVGPLTIRGILNQGAAFSLPVQLEVVVGAACVLLGLLVISLVGVRLSSVSRAGASFILIGGLSNLFDRIRHGGVIDIFTVADLSFNISDVYIIAGCLVILYRLFRASGKQNQEKLAI